MTSPYLERPLRPMHVVVAELLENMRDSFVLVARGRATFFFRETFIGQSFETVVTDLLNGEYDEGAPVVAVLRIARDAPAENVTEKVVAEIIDRINRNPDLAYDGERRLRSIPFLDNTCPNWERQMPFGAGKFDREYEREDA